jgi:hypothetical protein
MLWLLVLQMGDSVEDNVVNNGLELSTLVEENTCHVIMNLLNQAEDQVSSVHGARNILPTVEVDGHSICKSTLISQLNDNIFLSKDRLARIKLIFEFNNHDNCLQARSSCVSSLLYIGFDCRCILSNGA